MNQPYMDNNENLAVGLPICPLKWKWNTPQFFQKNIHFDLNLGLVNSPTLWFFPVEPVPPKLPIIGQPRSQPSIKTSDSQVSGTPGHARSIVLQKVLENSDFGKIQQLSREIQ
jgi:hypothetical protein